MAKGTETLEEKIEKEIDKSKAYVREEARLNRAPITYYEYIEDVYSDGKFIVMLFVEPLLRDFFEDYFKEKKYGDLTFTVFKGTMSKLIKLSVKQIKRDYKNILYGDEIESIYGSGFALYINWAEEGRIVLHKYEEGRFKSKSCKRTSYWETENGAWVVGISDCKLAGDIAGKINSFLEEGFGKQFNVVRHKLCIDEKECGGEK